MCEMQLLESRLDPNAPRSVSSRWGTLNNESVGQKTERENGWYRMSTVTPRNAYFAKHCPQRVQLDILRPCEPEPPSALWQRLAHDGVAYEVDVFRGIVDALERLGGH